MKEGESGMYSEEELGALSKPFTTGKEPDLLKLMPKVPLRKAKPIEREPEWLEVEIEWK